MKANNEVLEKMWASIPVGKQNAIDYTTLCGLWGMDRRKVRFYLSELSKCDNNDEFVLIRSSKNKGFYRTNDINEIRAYKKECLNKGKSILAAVSKCNRVLKGAQNNG